MLSAYLLLLAAFYQFSDTVQVVVSGALRGYKDTKAILYITLFCYWIIGMPIGYLLAMTDIIVPHLGAAGFWFAFIISLTCAAILLFCRMRRLQAIPASTLLARLEKIK